jgi:hypothetical protein
MLVRSLYWLIQMRRPQQPQTAFTLGGRKPEGSQKEADPRVVKDAATPLARQLR